MNIGIDIRPLMADNRTGVGEYTLELLNTIFKIDNTNNYFLTYNSKTDVSANIPKWDQQNVRYVSTKWPNKIFNASIKLLGVPRLDRLSFLRKQESKSTDLDSCFRRNDSGCKNNSVDVFFSPNINFISLSKNTKLILTIHDLSFEFFPEYLTLKQRLWHKAVNAKKLCERANVITTPSENTKRDLVDYYKISKEKIRVIYPGLSSGFLCHSCESRNPLLPIMDSGSTHPPWAGSGITNANRTTNEKYILFLGTIEPRKNIVGLIKAFEIFQKKYSTVAGEYKLFIAGAPGWKNSEIFELIRKSPDKDKIHYIGCVKNEDKPRLYSGASLFIYPSFYEGFGFPVLEAMTCGCPTITSNRSSLPEITESAAALIDPNRPEQLAWMMQNILTNQSLQEIQIKNGLEQAAKFTWENAAREWLSVLPS